VIKKIAVKIKKDLLRALSQKMIAQFQPLSLNEHVRNMNITIDRKT
jgi:hypothetical protein